MGKCIEEDGATLCLRHSLRALLEVTIEAGDSHFGLYAWTTFASCIFPSCPALQSTGAQSKRRSRDSYSNRAYSRSETRARNHHDRALEHSHELLRVTWERVEELLE